MLPSNQRPAEPKYPGWRGPDVFGNMTMNRFTLSQTIATAPQRHPNLGVRIRSVPTSRLERRATLRGPETSEMARIQGRVLHLHRLRPGKVTQPGQAAPLFSRANLPREEKRRVARPAKPQSGPLLTEAWQLQNGLRQLTHWNPPMHEKGWRTISRKQAPLRLEGNVSGHPLRVLPTGS